MKRLLRTAPEVWALVGFTLLYFRRPLTTGTFHYRDIELQFLPKKMFFGNMLRSGTLPLWDPLTDGGLPYLELPGRLYPGDLLFVLLPAVAALNLFIVGHFVMAAVGAWWLARQNGLSRTASFAAGAVYAFSGYTLSTANLFVHLVGVAWMPVVIALALEAARSRSRRHLVLAAIGATCPVLAGAVESGALMFGILLVWSWFDRDERTPRAQRLVIVLLVIGFSGALALVEIHPTMKVVANSSRGQGLDYEHFTHWSVDVRRLPELVLPQFLGRTDRFSHRFYWGRKLETIGIPYILSVYFGATAIALAAAGAAARRRLPGDRVPALPLALLAIAGVLFSLGRNLPLFRLLYDTVPLVTLFRFPVKAMMISILPIALLAGRGLDVIRSDARVRARAGGALAGFALLCLVLLTLTRRSADFQQWFPHTFFLQPPGMEVLDGLRSSFGKAFFFALAGVACVFLIGLRGPGWARGVAAVMLLDLAVAGIPVNPYAPRSLYREPEVAATVRGLIGDGRFHSYDLPQNAALRVPSPHEMWRSKWVIDTLGRYSASLFAIPVTLHEDYTELAPVRMSRIMRVVGSLPWPQRVAVLRAAGVRAFTTTHDLTLPEVRRIARVPSMEIHPLYLYAIPSAPMARFVSKVVPMRSEDEAYRTLLRGAPADAVLLEEATGPQVECGTAAVRIVERGLNRMRYAVDAPCQGYVRFAETWYPDWHVTVDGAESQLLRADYAFSAVKVPAGKHVIVREYRPQRLFVGAVLSLIAALLLAATAAFLPRILATVDGVLPARAA